MKKQKVKGGKLVKRSVESWSEYKQNEFLQVEREWEEIQMEELRYYLEQLSSLDESIQIHKKSINDIETIIKNLSKTIEMNYGRNIRNKNLGKIEDIHFSNIVNWIEYYQNQKKVHSIALKKCEIEKHNIHRLFDER
jgi:hypothetical protein